MPPPALKKKLDDRTVAARAEDSGIRVIPLSRFSLSVFFFDDTAPTDIYTLSLPDALPISRPIASCHRGIRRCLRPAAPPVLDHRPRDRESTRLNSSHGSSSYAAVCLK